MAFSNPKTRVLIIGSGGVGTMAAYALETGGKAEVTAVCRSNYNAAIHHGFTIDSLDHGHNITNFKPSQIRNTIPNIEQENIEPFEYVVVTTKNIPDIRPNVLDIIEPAITPGISTIVLLQNGYNIEKPIIAKFPENIVLSGISYIQANETSHGVILHDEADSCKCGPFPGQNISPERSEAAARRFIDLYNANRKTTWNFDEDVNFTRWRKLVYNTSFNSVSAILGMDTARMRMSRSIIDDLIRPAMLEIIVTARAAGVHLPTGIDDVLIRVDPVDTGFVPSMGQDVAKGNFIEMENIVGEPVREAESLGVDVPVLRTIYGLLKGIQLRMRESKGLWEARFEEGNPYA